MTRCTTVAALLSLALMGGGLVQSAEAQPDPSRNAFRIYQHSYQDYQPTAAVMNDATADQVEELPAGESTGEPYVVGDDGGELVWDDYGQGHDYGDYYGCGCAEDYGGSWSLTDGFFATRGGFYVGGEYLYVRASSSDASAYLEQNIEELETAPFDRVHQLDFQHESGFRFYGGYRLCDCGEEIRWTYTQFDSSAQTLAPGFEVSGLIQIHVPMEATGLPGVGGTIINGDIRVKSGDLEYAKTIPLGAPMDCCDAGCGECGDGCCDCEPCCGGCPAWDITWSGGVRFATADLRRTFVALDNDEEVLTNASSKISFDGGGPRFGLEGRRYFGCDGWFSAYLKGNISLLLGNVNIVNHRESTEDPGQVVSQYFRNRNVIPVTEIEAGMTCRATKYGTLSAGYLFSAWHDLGFRDQYSNLAGSQFGETYDDANILAFDGLFLRLEGNF